MTSILSLYRDIIIIHRRYSESYNSVNRPSFCHEPSTFIEGQAVFEIISVILKLKHLFIYLDLLLIISLSYKFFVYLGRKNRYAEKQDDN